MQIFKEAITFTRKEGKHTACVVGVTSTITDLEAAMPYFLSGKESDKAKSYLYTERRLSFLLGRYAAKEAICEMLAVKDKTLIEIRSGVFNQPIVVHEGKEQLAVGIAHTDTYAVGICYSEDHPLGIDIEAINSKNTDMIIDQLTQSETTILTTTFCKDQLSIGTTLFWTIKEAMAKCIKTGLMTPLSVFEIDEVKKTEKGFVATFSNFGQYKALSYVVEEMVLTIVTPKNSDIQYESEKQFIFNQADSKSALYE